jgi:2-oxoglutarate ferredoxin oxidoreductase subunit alpha
VLFGRHGEAPVPVVAPRSPSDAFDAAVEAARMAPARLTPMPVLSDGAMVNGSESWRIPAEDELPDLRVELVTGPTGERGLPGVRSGDAGGSPQAAAITQSLAGCLVQRWRSN